jgi:hypothetical protein
VSFVAFKAMIQEATFSYGCLIPKLRSYPAQTFTFGITMSGYLAQRLRSQQIEALKIQEDYLRVVRDRHLAWTKAADNIEINPIRHEIIDLIEKTIAQYDQLLEALRRPIEGD